MNARPLLGPCYQIRELLKEECGFEYVHDVHKQMGLNRWVREISEEVRACVRRAQTSTERAGNHHTATRLTVNHTTHRTISGGHRQERGQDRKGLRRGRGDAAGRRHHRVGRGRGRRVEQQQQQQQQQQQHWTTTKQQPATRAREQE